MTTPEDETAAAAVNTRTIDVSPFAKRSGHCMRWKNITMQAILPKPQDDSKTTRTILQDLTGSAPSGQVTAIMGPSGSGKTSLLNVLSGRITSIRNKLTVTYDGLFLDEKAVDPKDINVRQRIAFVAQDDSLPVTATPREAILFSARLRLPVTMSQKDLTHLTTTMLEELNLTSCADTVVGGTLVKGLSGGERKRTSVAVELVTQPNIVFLDEPSSGLDSFNALELCQVLKKVADAGSAVLMTIHQPSSDIFLSLDRLILLLQGRVMYSGKTASVVDYFSRRGYPCPAQYNPADFILTVAQSQTVAQLSKDGFFDSDEAPAEEEENNNNSDSLQDATSHSVGVVPDAERVGLVEQVKLLFQREVQNLVRNKKALMARTGMTVMVSTLGGIIFFQVADSDFTEFINLQSTFGGLMVSLLANVFSTALPSLVAFPEERPVFIREYSTNHYSVTAYFLSRLTMELFVTAAQVTVSSIITYFMVGYSGTFGIFWADLYALALTSTALGVLLGCSTKDPGVAVEFLPAIFMPQILLAGFFVPHDLIPVWVRWVSYLFPLTYATRIVVVNEFDGRCDGLSPDWCEALMENLNVDPDEVWWYWIVLLCQMAFFRLLALFILKKKASSYY